MNELIELFAFTGGRVHRFSDLDFTDIFQQELRTNHPAQLAKRTLNALAFEVDYEANLLQLHEEINSSRYQPGRSIAFVINKPVEREIFAADFRDRVVHHLVIHKLNPLFEKLFIHDSYACRTGKGTQFGIQRVARFIRQCSRNYTQDCYVLKLDIRGFFMHINKAILFAELEALIHRQYRQPDKPRLLELCRKNRLLRSDRALYC